MNNLKENKIKQYFKVNTVGIKGSNIIEASAGTGKTYSIAILVLRFIIEKDIPLKKILMVTFTRTAVAELEIRIRAFIRIAQQIAKGKNVNDATIQELIITNIAKHGEDKVLKNLALAKSQLDETSIYTIHSFCQKILNEFAFETKQLFNCEVIDSEDPIIQEGVDKYWRENITTLPKERLSHLIEWNLNRTHLKDVAIRVLSGKQLKYKTIVPDKIIETLDTNIQEIIEAKDKFLNIFKTSNESKLTYISSKTYAKKTFPHLIDNPEGFKKLLLEKQGANYVPITFPNLLELALIWEEKHNKAKLIVSSIYGNASEFVKEFVKTKKRDLAVFSYNDLIQQLHSITKDKSSNKALSSLLKDKYDSFFIDEFQDTDKQQYEIFDSLFSKNTIKFYIGDPKQSIYAFRGADLNTYKTAVASADNLYTMDTNYRSSDNLIEAYNNFYNAVSNPFQDTEINYETVKSTPKKTFAHKGNPIEKPLKIIKCDNNEITQSEVVTFINKLLFSNEYKIGKKDIKPQDIGILVRGNKTAKQYKLILAKQGIPAVTIDETNVLQTKESQLVIYLLEAILSPTTSNLNRVFLSNFSNRNTEDLLSYNKDWDIDAFKNLKELWNKKGIYTACKSFLTNYNVVIKLKKNNEDAERILSNLFQIFELLHKQYTTSKCTPQELLNWLHLSFLGATNTIGDSYTQRLETDENAVQIATIHKSKGLAYNIVIAPELDLMTKAISGNNPICEYKDPFTKNSYFTFHPSEEEIELYNIQSQQENERLLYVALTRSVHATYIFKNEKNKNKSTLKPYVIASEENDSVQIKVVKGKEEEIDYKKTLNKKTLQINALNYKGGKLKDSWKKISFSSLSQAHQFTPYQESTAKNNYDHFTFDLLPRGAESGNFIHNLFENINFNQVKLNDSQYVIKKTTRNFSGYYKNENNEIDISNYLQFVIEVLYSKIQLNENTFSLADIDDAKKVPELEFLFTLKDADISKLAKTAEVFEFVDYKKIEGMLSGFIDLFFEHQGKYYILDWKSNYIGNSIKDYCHEKIYDSMKANNYHFQYLIYTIAIKRYLTQKIPNFNYEHDFGGCIYVYVRGCRKDKVSGIFTTKPSIELIEKLEACIS